MSLLSAIVAPVFQLACSGPAAGEVMMANGAYASFMYLVGVALVLALVYDASRLGFFPNTLKVALLLQLIHPGLWMSTQHGDCGYMARNTSIAATILIGILFILHAFLADGWHQKKAAAAVAEAESPYAPPVPKDPDTPPQLPR